MKVIAFVCGFLVWTAGLGGVSGCAATPSEAAFEVIANIQTGDNPHGIWFDRTRDLAYVACSGADQIDVIDCRTLKVIDSLPAGNVPLDVVASADERYLIATQFREGELIKFRRNGGPVEERWKWGKGGLCSRRGSVAIWFIWSVSSPIGWWCSIAARWKSPRATRPATSLTPRR